MAEMDPPYRGFTESTGFKQTARYVNELSESQRWETFPTPMLHRSNLYWHKERTKKIAGNIIYYIVEEPELVELVALDAISSHHDDHELIDTDKASPLKEDMTPEEKENEMLQEISSFEIVGRKYLQLEGSELEKYMEAMINYQRKNTLVTQIVDVADKLDAIGEALHEIRCGNVGFINGYQFYRKKKLKNFEKYPFWQKLINDPAIGFNPMPTVDELLDIPKLSVDDLKTREGLKHDVYDPALPAWYRSWLGISYDLLKDDPQPELHLFPGWKNDLRMRWNYDKK